eukprot:TRINITY_DN3806_c0_g1_i7.p1 TRINITY_DN3806_c0_g1~~TRINITY_DN3806_c0_g1_i7.p1  ORF type:complete len:100 (+),score=34.07 TRINITY_DN3806_c0_g1_i7:127-426(+)
MEGGDNLFRVTERKSFFELGDKFFSEIEIKGNAVKNLPEVLENNPKELNSVGLPDVVGQVQVDVTSYTNKGTEPLNSFGIKSNPHLLVGSLLLFCVFLY